MNTQAKQPIKAMPIKQFAQEKDFKQIVPTVRANTNNYPYLTFIDSKNVAENVYFSKAGSKLVTEGMPVTKEVLAQFQVAETTNEAGEKRMKLISNSERVELGDLL